MHTDVTDQQQAKLPETTNDDEIGISRNTPQKMQLCEDGSLFFLVMTSFKWKKELLERTVVARMICYLNNRCCAYYL